MKVKVTEKVLGYEGKPVKDGEKDLEWLQVFFIALNNFTQDEKPTSEVKSRCYQITKKLYDSNEPDLTVEERSFLIERVRKMFTSPLVCGRVEEFLEEK